MRDICETRHFGLFILESRVIANVNIQKSKMSTIHGEIVANGGCLAQKVVAFFFLRQRRDTGVTAGSVGAEMGIGAGGEARLTGWLDRTKTTGPGKAIRWVPFHVNRVAGLAGVAWLEQEMALLHGAELSWERDYFLPAASRGHTGPVRRICCVSQSDPAAVMTMRRGVASRPIT